MAALGLDAEIVARFDPDLFDAMRRACATCGSAERCLLDLTEDDANPVWQHYCPNCPRLRDIGRLPWLGGIVGY